MDFLIREDWRSNTMVNGEQCVMIGSAIQMLKWLATILALGTFNLFSFNS